MYKKIVKLSIAVFLLLACSGKTAKSLKKEHLNKGESASLSSLCDKDTKLDEKQKKECKNLAELGKSTKNSTKIKIVPPLPEGEVISFLKDKCSSCHNSQTGGQNSFWSIDVKKVNKQSLINDPASVQAYYTLILKAKGLQVGKPRAMPPSGLSTLEKEKLLGVISWFRAELPSVVSSAREKYADGAVDSNSGVGIKVNFSCKESDSFRRFMNRITNDLFDRPPTTKELNLVSKDKIDKAITFEDRLKVVSRVRNDFNWYKEFLKVGLKKFADKISGSADISASGDKVTKAEVKDLQGEFYQYLLKYGEVKPWKDILLQKNVLVTSNTARFYKGCDTTDKGWVECDLQKPRGSFFTTAAYLRSKPSSFLVDNNNYGRATLMHFIVSGDVFVSAFDGDTGATVNSLPKCLQSNDFRGAEDSEGNFAPYGAMAVPGTGNLCQSCHIDRQMAAGSMLFRPFDQFGTMWSKNNKFQDDTNFEAAVADDKKNRPDLKNKATSVAVNEAFLAGLLAEDAKACAVGYGDEKDVALSSVADLAKFIIGDGKILASGLARHIPRALSNVPNTTEEIIIKVKKAYETSNGLLFPMIKAYLISETYACKAEESAKGE